MGFPVVRPSSISTITSTKYADLAEWVAAPPGGRLRHLILQQNATAFYRFIIGQRTVFEEAIFSEGLGEQIPLPFDNTPVDPGEDGRVRLQARSPGGTTAAIGGIIIGYQLDSNDLEET